MRAAWWRVSLVLLICAAGMTMFSSSARAQCGQTTSVVPRHSAVRGQAPPLALGDSVLYDVSGELAHRGFEVNAMVCRTMTQGTAWLRARGSRLPHLVVLALGTNGYMTQGDIDNVLGILGPRRLLAMVTPHHGDLAYLPGVIRAAVSRHRGRILLLDWDRLSAGHPEWFAPDGIHLGGSTGINAYANLVAGALAFALEPCVS